MSRSPEENFQAPASGVRLKQRRLEDKFQTHHHLPPVPRGSNFTESRVGLRTIGGELSCRPDGIELRVVKGVKGLPPELKAALFISQRESLEQGQVMVVEPGVRELRVVAVVPQIATATRPFEHPGIEPLIDGSLISWQNGTACLHDTGTADFTAAREIKVIGRREGDVRNLSRREGGDTQNLPAIQDLPADRIRHDPAPLGNVIGVTENRRVMIHQRIAAAIELRRQLLVDQIRRRTIVSRVLRTTGVCVGRREHEPLTEPAVCGNLQRIVSAGESEAADVDIAEAADGSQENIIVSARIGGGRCLGHVAAGRKKPNSARQDVRIVVVGLMVGIAACIGHIEDRLETDFPLDTKVVLVGNG